MSNRNNLRIKRAKISRARKLKSNAIPFPPREPMMVVESKVIEAAWNALAAQTIPLDTHPELVKAFRRFFYAGAKSLVDTFLYTDCLDESAPDQLTKSDGERFAGIANEVQDFFTEVASARQ